MGAKKITKKPSLAVKSLSAPSRVSGRTMKATWSIPNDLVSTKKNDRATDLEIDWTLGIAGTPKSVTVTGNEKLTEHSINLDSVKIGSTTYTRSSFYPFGGKPTLSYVTVQVFPKNKKGKGKEAKTTAYFQKPRAPQVSDLSFNSETGNVSATITTDAGSDQYERYDTRYTVMVRNTRTGQTWNSSDSSSTSTEFSVSYNVSDYQQLTYGQFVQVTVKAWSRGYAGDSGAVSRTIYIGYPAQAAINGIDVSDKSIAGKCTVRLKTNSTTEHPVDRVRLSYLTNVTYATVGSIPASASWTESDITDDSACTALAIPVANLMPDRGKHTWVRVKSYHLSESVLYRYSEAKEVAALFTPAPTAADDEISIISVTAGTKGDSAIVALGWNADGQDDSTGTELTWSDEEDTWRSTETPNNYTFTWTDGVIYGLTNDTTVVSGKKYYTKSGDTYSQVSNPSGNPKSLGYYEKYLDSATITIKNLEESTKYYIKARRYLTDEDVTTYSPYSNTATCYTSETPDVIVATCNRYVSKGNSLAVRWTFSGNGLQTEWRIVANVIGYALTADTAIVNGKQYYIRSGSGTAQSPYVYTEVESPVVANIGTYYEQTYTDTAIIASGEGSAGTALISAERLQTFAVNNSITFNVQASTGSGFVVSESHTVTILEKPTLSLTASATLTAQPYSFTATTNRLCDLIVIVTSEGATGQFPTGVKMQSTGDTIHSEVYSPIWTSSNGAYTSTVTLPTGLDFWNLGRYTMSVVAVDRTTSLKSDEVVATFSVAWTNPAVNPSQLSYTATTDTTVVEDEAYYEKVDSEYFLVTPVGTENPSTEGWYTQTVTEFVTLTPIDSTDADGDHMQAVQIALTPPTGSASTDVYDIYRMDVENASLIGEGFPLTHTVVDEYAPFGSDLELRYRFAIRTADGDIAFSDIEYTAPCKNMRFDWAGGFLELPYGLTIGDSYKKDAEIRYHMDGSVDGYWNKNIERKSSLGSAIIKIIQPKDIERTRLLARYTGPVFVRLPNGSAYEADVQITDLSVKNEAVTTIQVDATEIGLTDEFKLPIPFDLEEEE